MTTKLPITAMVVGRNEAHLLNRCLSSVSFCNEILYTDILSSDNSKSIALNFNASIYESELIPSCEFAQADMVHKAKNDWVLFIDPDEYLDVELVKQLIDFYPNLSKSSHIGAVRVPWLFYFGQTKLIGTVWGSNSKYILVHKDRFTFNPIIHYGRELNVGYESFEIKLNSERTNVLHHAWMPSFKVFFLKHFRYLKNEGRDRFKTGRRITLLATFVTPLNAFYKSFILKRGFKNGFLGFTLSIFWALYETVANFSLLGLQIFNKYFISK